MYRFSYYIPVVFILSTPPAGAEDRVEFNRDVRPILSENCFFCHGFDSENREADLRLDTFEGATAEGVIVPGNPEQSELLRRIVSHDPDEVMPPPDTEKHITKEQAEIIRRWIQQGAEYQEHWAWRKLERPHVPDGSSGAAAIDSFGRRRADYRRRRVYRRRQYGGRLRARRRGRTAGHAHGVGAGVTRSRQLEECHC